MTATAQERWLDCLLEKGMFSDEVTVSYPPEGQTTHSVFVPVDVVRGALGTRGKVRVVVIRKNGKTLALLPSQERTIVAVDDRDVTDSP